MRDRRSRQAARARSVRDPAHEHDAGDDRIESIWRERRMYCSAATASTNVSIWWKTRWKAGAGCQSPRGSEWLEGSGIAHGHAGTRVHRPSTAQARRCASCPTGRIISPSARPKWAMARATSHRQLAACSARTRAGRNRNRQRRHRQNAVRHRHVRQHRHGRRRTGGGDAALALRDNIFEFAGRHAGCEPADCRLQDDGIICANRKISLAELYAEAEQSGPSLRRHPQSLSLAPLGRIQRAGRAARGASRHRRDR